MAYAAGNPKTKKQLKEWIAARQFPIIFSPGPFPVCENGEDVIEGPHYPEPHRWYARVLIQNGHIVKVLS